MKALKVFGVLMAAVSLALTTVSCGEEVGGNFISELNEGVFAVTAEIKRTDEGNLIIKVNRAGVCHEDHVATFDEEQILVSYVETISYSNNNFTDMAVEDIKNSNPTLAYTRDGKNIIIDHTSEHYGKNYSEILAVFQKMKKECKKSGASYKRVWK